MSAPATASLTGAIETSGDHGAPPLDTNTVATGSQVGEMVAHTHAVNTIDMAYYNRFFFLTALQWSAKEVYGQTIYQLPLKPANMWKNLRLLERMYYAWQGGFDISVRVAGTGFNGGMLAVVKTPPGIDLNDTSEAAWSYYSRIELDPKELTPVGFSTTDQRATHFHWTFNTNDSRFGSLNEVGGNLWFVVVLPLITAQRDVDAAVNLAIFAKCGQDFSFSGIKEADETGKVENSLKLYRATNSEYSYLLEHPNFPEASIDNIILSKLSNATKCVSSDGKEAMSPVIPIHESDTTVPGTGESTYTMSFSGVPKIVGTTVWMNAFQSNSDKNFSADLNTARIEGDYNKKPMSVSAHTGYKILGFSYNTSGAGEYSALAPNGEAIIFFDNKATNEYQATLTRTLQAEWFDIWTLKQQDGFDPIFQLKSKDGRTLCYMRWVNGGYFTTNMPAAETKIPIPEVKENLEFYGYLPRTTVLPANPPTLDLHTVRTKTDELKRLLALATV